jgi:hypothetical protein
MKAAALLLVLCALTVTAARSQQKRPAPHAATSTVSGHVYCADTNAPARMANVVLQPANQIDAIRPGEDETITSRGQLVQTLLDGSFSIPNVEPGVYYVIATQPGYVSPLTAMYAPAADAPATSSMKPKKPVMTAPRIVVQGSVPVSVIVSIERGAAVSGSVLYDDGSPAVGIRVSVLVRAKSQWTNLPTSPVASQSYSAGTDDQGLYRISGLPAGEYLLEAHLSLYEMFYKVAKETGTSVSQTATYSLSVYAGGSSRRKDARTMTVTAGEELGGQDIEIPLSKLHTVRGSIVAAHDGHILNGGQLSLLYGDDRSEASRAYVSKDDSTFTFGFVPEGDYIIQARGVDNDYVEVQDPAGSWPATHTETKFLRSYGTAEQAIHVAGELAGIVVSAPDPSPQPARPALQ